MPLILLLLVKSLRSERKAKKSLRALKESLGREEKQQQELDATKNKAYTDPLTGVKSKNAYAEMSHEIQRSIANGEKPEFAIVVFDVNDLKKSMIFTGMTPAYTVISRPDDFGANLARFESDFIRSFSASSL